MVDPSHDETKARRHGAPPASEALRQWQGLDWSSAELAPVRLSRGAPAAGEALIDARSLLPAGERYTFGSELGRGGVGSVTVAHDNRLDRDVALKRLLSETPSPESLHRFLVEAQVTAQLEHPNVVDIHDFGADETGGPSSPCT